MTRWALAALVTLCACRPTSTPQAPIPDPFREQPYNTAPASPNAQVFLVAGGDDVANFAAEVLEQRTLWRRAGLREDQIACYYAKPTAEAYADDRAQYDALATALASCRAATPEQLFADLRSAAQTTPDFVYLFVSSHGLPSQLGPLQRSKRPKTQQFVASLSDDERDVLAPTAIGLEAGPGPGLGAPRQVVAALRRGTPPTDLVFTPRTLAEALSRFAPSVHKVVVLQACFSGGFIDHHVQRAADPSAGAETLLDVPNLTVLTATAAERPSFGCGSGEARTYFGAAVTVVLGNALKQAPPHALVWEDIFANVVTVIEAMEAVADQRASMPGFVHTGEL